MKRFRKNLKIYIAILCFVFFYLILNMVLKEYINVIDRYGYDLIYSKLRSNFFTYFFSFVTNLVSTPVLVSIILLCFAFIKNKIFPTLMSLNLMFIVLINLVLKTLVSRPRPDYGLIYEGGYSFPSGHSMVSMAFYGFIMYLVYYYVKDKKKKFFYLTLLFMLILIIGISRVYLGVHYGSDVVGGFFISASYLLMYISFVKSYLVKE